MKTFVQPGEALELTAPAGGVLSGQPYKIGSLLVIATGDALATLAFEGVTHGVFLGTKPANEAWTECVKIYWDNTARKFTTTAGGNTLVGVAAAAAPVAVTITSSADPSDLLITDDAIEVLDYTGLEDKTITIVIARDNGQTETYVLTEADTGGSFNAVTSNKVTAAAIAAAITALLVPTSVNTLALAVNDADMTTNGSTTVTIATYTGIAGKTVTVTINGVATVLTEGVDFDAETDNNTTATNLAAAIDGIDGVTAAAASAVVTVALQAVQVLSDANVNGHVRLDGAAR